jgi:hypothetical protein
VRGVERDKCDLSRFEEARRSTHGITRAIIGIAIDMLVGPTPGTRRKHALLIALSCAQVALR